MKVFISHSSKDKLYGNLLSELLVGLKLTREEIIYTSNDLYGIPLGKNIYDYLRDNIESDIHMIFLLSENYFQSVACLNEMGASWLAQKDHTIIGVPGFDFKMQKFQDCCLDSKEMGFDMSNYFRVTEFKENLEGIFGKKIGDMEWQALIEKYKRDLTAIAGDTNNITHVENNRYSEDKEYERNILINVLDWSAQLLKFAERCSTQLENSLKKDDPEIRRKKYGEFSDSLSEMTQEYYINENKYILLLESIGSRIDLNGGFHNEVKEFIDNLRTLGEDYIHQPDTRAAVDINNRIFKRFEDAVFTQQKMIEEDMKNR